jgi:potassium-transporting ATPase KdpC subunit
MKSNIFPALKLTLVSIVFFVLLYTMLIWGFGQVIAPNAGKGEVVNYTTTSGASAYGYANIGQAFTADQYFWSRPSAVGYNASGSGASNKGATNADYLAQVQDRIDSFMVHNPSIKKSHIPVELVTASGSGLDPHISPKAALVQVPRIASVRNLSEDVIRALVTEYTEQPQLGMFGPSQVNVLKINIALDQLK